MTEVNFEEIYAPIKISELYINDMDMTIQNVEFFNVVCVQKKGTILVQDLDSLKYKKISDTNYVRDPPITRYSTKEAYWPINPGVTVSTKFVDNKPILNRNNKGAIIIIRSMDEHYLLVCCNNLWGLPKGARAYRAFLTIKDITDKHYLSTGNAHDIVHGKTVFDEEETSEENIRRETREETGIIIPLEDSKLEKYPGGGLYDRFTYRYPKTIKEYENDLLVNGVDHENDALKWVNRKDLLTMIKNHLPPENKVFNATSFQFLVHYLNLETLDKRKRWPSQDKDL
jgi:8-oxo-dGTP pyrophosphatase MutT (NUDIX family)